VEGKERKGKEILESRDPHLAVWENWSGVGGAFDKHLTQNQN
jgi:hypothetical protein